MTRLPGGELGRRPLHIIWILDTSGSMSGQGKIQQLNLACREALPHLCQAASENPFAEVLVRVVTFSDGAQWHVPTPTSLNDFTWTDLTAVGSTAMGQALRLVAQALDEQQIGPRALPPVLVLVSDGQPTDDFDHGLTALLGQPWGKKAVRLAIAIGQDADREGLRKFVADPERPVLEAKNPEALVDYFRWASTALISQVSGPTLQGAVNGPPIPIPADGGEVDVW